jgi:squalene-hopene/tetraprenyl-beta-curcumene cyclase
MRSRLLSRVVPVAVSFGLITSLATTLCAADPIVGAVTIENFQDPGPNEAGEAKRVFSLASAASFLDSAALTWHQQRQCFTCHTNLAYLYSRPLLSGDAPAVSEVRKQCEEIVNTRWPEKGPRWDAEVVAVAAALATHDRHSSGKLADATRTALDKMWTVQRDDGGISWLKCEWPPMESDDHYGATLMAIAAGVAPGDYANQPATRAGLDKLKKWFATNPPTMLHHEAMLLWANSYHAGLVTDEMKSKSIESLRGLQRPDGGWAFASLGDWKRGDDKTQDVATSDGYGTGFVVYVLRRAGVAADDPQLAKGVAWLKENQRESGRWFTRSAFKDSKHFISHAGTAFAVMALHECGEK